MTQLENHRVIMLHAIATALVNSDESNLVPRELFAIERFEKAGYWTAFVSPLFSDDPLDALYDRCEVTGDYGECIECIVPFERKEETA